MPDLNQQANAKDFKSFVSTNFTNEANLKLSKLNHAINHF
jgi:hypothetical protein